MKKITLMLVLLVCSLSLIACSKNEVNDNTSTNEEVGVNQQEQIISNDSSESGEDQTDPSDEMIPEVVNARLERYISDSAKGVIVTDMIEYVKTENEDNTFPIPVSIVYEDELSEDAIISTENYKIRVFDSAPGGNLDGYVDLIIISKAEDVNPSGEF